MTGLIVTKATDLLVLFLLIADLVHVDCAVGGVLDVGSVAIAIGSASVSRATGTVHRTDPNAVFLALGGLNDRNAGDLERLDDNGAQLVAFLTSLHAGDAVENGDQPVEHEHHRDHILGRKEQVSVIDNLVLYDDVQSHAQVRSVLQEHVERNTNHLHAYVVATRGHSPFLGAENGQEVRGHAGPTNPPIAHLLLGGHDAEAQNADRPARQHHSAQNLVHGNRSIVQSFEEFRNVRRVGEIDQQQLRQLVMRQRAFGQGPSSDDQ